MSSLTTSELDAITQQIKRGSVLPLRNDVAQDLAENILTAQSNAPYAGPVSLQDSINSTLKAISLEQSFGVRYCDDNDCAIVWSQSMTAIDPSVVIGITPSSINFGPVAVSTPEPTTALILIAAILSLVIVRRLTK